VLLGAKYSSPGITISIGDLNVDPNHVHLVRVMTNHGERRLWAAATLREEAVSRVLEAIPKGWSACLLDDCLKPRQDVVLTMVRGEVRELAR
jgi:hypothetical protein